DLFCAFQYVYLMHLLFFLSGLFVWPSLSRKGGRRFLYDRFVGLGIQFAVGLFLLMPLAYYPVYCITAVDPSWSAFLSHWIARPRLPRFAQTAATFQLSIVPNTPIFERPSLPSLQIDADLGFILCAGSTCPALFPLFLRFAGPHRPMFERLADNAYGIYLVRY